METEKIEPRHLLIIFVLVAGIEWGASHLCRETGLDRLLLVGLVRGVQIGSILLVVKKTMKSLAPIGLGASVLQRGIKRGAVWSLAFCTAAVGAGVIMAAAGVNPLKMISVGYPPEMKRMILLVLVGGIIGPAAEEVFFRGVIYGYLRRTGVVFAVFLSTLVFVSAHAIAAGVPFPRVDGSLIEGACRVMGFVLSGFWTQIIGGIVFAVAYEVEKSLMTPIVIHVSGNLALYGLSWIA